MELVIKEVHNVESIGWLMEEVSERIQGENMVEIFLISISLYLNDYYIPAVLSQLY